MLWVGTYRFGIKRALVKMMKRQGENFFKNKFNKKDLC